MKPDDTKLSVQPAQAICSVDIHRISDSQILPEHLHDDVVLEQALTVMVDKVGSFTILCTPLDIEALAIGFVYSEGMIDSIDDVVDVAAKPELQNVVGIKVENPAKIAIKRNLIVASSCGMCGSRNIEKLLTEMPGCGRSLSISSKLIVEVTGRLRSLQQVFQATGGSHAAGIFDSSGNIIASAEDIGRHNALDKVIGKCLLTGQPTKGCGVALSGRASFEMVSKSARAGIELIAAVSAPSSFAIDAANRWNITLCGFVRPDRLNIYTHPERICELQKEIRK